MGGVSPASMSPCAGTPADYRLAVHVDQGGHGAYLEPHEQPTGEVVHGATGRQR